MVNQIDEPEEQQTVKQNLSRKGKKGERGRPQYHDQKKERKQYMLTPTAIGILEKLAARQNLSYSSTLELLLREIGDK